VHFPAALAFFLWIALKINTRVFTLSYTILWSRCISVLCRTTPMARGLQSKRQRWLSLVKGQV
jgi:hypothetical protein